MVEDGWNRGIAGCSTGLVLGWKAGPWSAVQSCVGLGLISALIDLGSGVVRELKLLRLDQLRLLQHQHQMGVNVMPSHAAAADWQSLLAQLSQACSSEQRQQTSTVSSHYLRPVGTGQGAQHAQQQQQQQQQHLLMQPLQLMQPAVDVVQQIVHAPPLSFLSACCNGSTDVSVAGAAVDACDLLSPGVLKLKEGKRQQ